jgi:hypothetical protein
MLRRPVGFAAVVLAAAALVLTGCTSSPPSPSSSALPTMTSTPSPSPSDTPTLTPTPTATPTRPALPAVRWDKVQRGTLPGGCVTVGGTRVFVHAGTVYAKGPSLQCGSGGPYWVRAVVKVAEYHGNGHWTYLTEVHPSPPARNAAPAQRTEPLPCPAGRTVRAVASFVLTWPDGHQVRYRRIGTSARCS